MSSPVPIHDPATTTPLTTPTATKLDTKLDPKTDPEDEKPRPNSPGTRASQDDLDGRTLPVEPDFPEGGFKAWSMVFAAFLMTFSTFGLVNTYVFQEYYSITLLKDESPSTIAWIGSVQYSLVFLPGLVSGRLFDIGIFHGPLIAASLLLIVSVFLTAECTVYWQFMLCQGIALGIGAGFVFGPSLGVVAHYFKRRRSTAYGVLACGSSTGGTLLPIAVRKLIPRIGFPWTMRVLGFILIVTLGVPNLIARRRLPPNNVSGGLFNLKAFKYAPYSLYVAAITIGFLGMYTVLTYIDVGAISVGVSSDFAFYLISIANTGSMFGRLMSGYLSDRVGPLNVLIPFSVVAAIMTFAWPYCTNVASLVVVGFIYGIASGAFVGLIASPISAFGKTEDIGRRIGMLFTVAAVGAVTGPPISGAIHDAQHSYHAVGGYAGAVIIVCCAFMIASRYKALGGWKLTGKF